ncbi:hypothetical protein E3T46_12235 [Cryobacterium sp. Hh11]|nr:hypothetical protein E3T46_12235 [Cryobacterium sp. Hh11]
MAGAHPNPGLVEFILDPLARPEIQPLGVAPGHDGPNYPLQVIHEVFDVIVAGVTAADRKVKVMKQAGM